MPASMKAVKLRMKSIQSTMQITRAMELVASSRLRGAKLKADAARPGFEILRNTLAEIAAGNTDFMSPYTRPSAAAAHCYVVVGGDRGLAGGYNANVFREMEERSAGQERLVLPVGKKAVEYYRSRKAEILTDRFAEVSELSISDCFEIARLLCREYRAGRFGHASLCYTAFESMLSQKPQITALLPLEDFCGQEKRREDIRSLILYEPDSETVFDAIVPEYLSALLYGALCESIASELAARRMAMDAATKNAGEMIEQLGLYYNRARQAGITQEITEIVAGAEGS